MATKRGPNAPAPPTTVSQRWSNRIQGQGMVSPRDVVSNPRNWRRHPKHQLDALRGVLRQVGWVQQLVVNTRTGLLVDGHARLDLALRDGEKEVPVLYVDLSPDEEALILATLDPISALAETDQDALAPLLEQARTADEGLQFFLDEMRQEITGHHVNGSCEVMDDDEAPEPNDLLLEKWRTEIGQLWIIPSLTQPGRVHRLLCGDSTNPRQVNHLLDGARPFLMVTDQPWGIDYTPGWRDEQLSPTTAMWDGPQARVAEGIQGDDRSDWAEAWNLFPGDVAYVWHGSLAVVNTALGLVTAGFELRSHLIWTKQHFAVSRGHYHWKHEPCWYAVRRGATAEWVGDRAQTTVWDDIASLNPLGRQEERVDHPTQKPIECMARPMRHHAGDSVYDPFLGSGTSILAAETTRRACFALELDPRYVAVTLERLTNRGMAPVLLTPDAL